MRCAYCVRKLHRRMRVIGMDATHTFVEVPTETIAGITDAFVPSLLPGCVEQYDPADYRRPPRTVYVHHGAVCEHA